MGDVAMLVPPLLRLLAQNPGIRITVLTKKMFAPIFEALPNTIVYHADVKGKHKGFLGLYRLYRELKVLEIDKVADMHNVLRSKVLKFFFRLSGTSIAQLDKGRKEKKWLTRWSEKEIKPLKHTHDRYVAVFGKLGYTCGENSTKYLPKPMIPAPFFAKGTTLNVGIAPFAAHQGKIYPIHLMEMVVARLVAHNDIKILLFGGGEREAKVLHKFEERFGKKVQNMANKITFKEELAIISHLDAMVSMDSGNAHLAANYGVPVITLWGVTHPFTGFAPYAQPAEYQLVSDRKEFPYIPTSVYGNRYPKEYEKAIETITPEQVCDLVLSVVKR